MSYEPQPWQPKPYTARAQTAAGFDAIQNHAGLLPVPVFCSRAT
jgi:hypothetical protein